VAKARSRAMWALVESFGDAHAHLVGTRQRVVVVERAADGHHLVGHTKCYAQARAGCRSAAPAQRGEKPCLRSGDAANGLRGGVDNGMPAPVGRRRGPAAAGLHMQRRPATRPPLLAAPRGWLPRPTGLPAPHARAPQECLGNSCKTHTAAPGAQVLLEPAPGLLGGVAEVRIVAASRWSVMGELLRIILPGHVPAAPDAAAGAPAAAPAAAGERCAASVPAEPAAARPSAAGASADASAPAPVETTAAGGDVGPRDGRGCAGDLGGAAAAAGAGLPESGAPDERSGAGASTAPAAASGAEAPASRAEAPGWQGRKGGLEAADALVAQEGERMTDAVVEEVAASVGTAGRGAAASDARSCGDGSGRADASGSETGCEEPMVRDGSCCEQGGAPCACWGGERGDTPAQAPCAHAPSQRLDAQPPASAAQPSGAAGGLAAAPAAAAAASERSGKPAAGSQVALRERAGAAASAPAVQSADRGEDPGDDAGAAAGLLPGVPEQRGEPRLERAPGSASARAGPAPGGRGARAAAPAVWWKLLRSGVRAWQAGAHAAHAQGAAAAAGALCARAWASEALDAALWAGVVLGMAGTLAHGLLVLFDGRLE